MDSSDALSRCRYRERRLNKDWWNFIKFRGLFPESTKRQLQLHSQRSLCNTLTWDVLLSRRSRQRERLSASVLSICSSVSLSVTKMQKTRFSQKLSNLELRFLLTTYRKLCNWAFQRTYYWIPKIQHGWDRHLEKSTWPFLSAEGGPIWIRFRRLVQNDMSTALMWSKSKPDVEFQYGGRLGKFNGMSFQITCHIVGCCHLANSMS